jgi:hypothetical protein
MNSEVGLRKWELKTENRCQMTKDGIKVSGVGFQVAGYKWLKVKRGRRDSEDKPI